MWYADDDTGEPIQLDDTDGDPLTVRVYHFGPDPIAALDGNGDPRMIFAGWAAGRLTALVDYCW